MLAADYFDGRSSRRHEVRLEVGAAGLRLTGPGISRAEPWRDVEVGERTDGAPWLLRFASGGYVAVHDAQALAPLLAAAGRREGLVQRGQRSWGLALGAVAAVAAIAVAGYAWGVPWLATAAAARVPEPVVRDLSERSLATLDRHLLQPSQLPPARRAAIAEAWRALLAHSPGQAGHVLLFRSSPGIGPNAFAFPDGRMVLLDELVDVAAGDAQVLAVLAHELGHVHHRHGLRLLFQTAIVGSAAAWWLGDVSILLAAAPAALLNSRYSRALELEADAFAVPLLIAGGLPPAALAEVLERLEAAHRPPGPPDPESHWTDYLSSHPSTRERSARLRGS